MNLSAPNISSRSDDKSVAEKIKDQDNAYIIGKAENYPMALEAAIKIQEVSYVN